MLNLYTCCPKSSYYICWTSIADTLLSSINSYSISLFHFFILFAWNSIWFQKTLICELFLKWRISGLLILFSVIFFLPFWISLSTRFAICDTQKLFRGRFINYFFHSHSKILSIFYLNNGVKNLFHLYIFFTYLRFSTEDKYPKKTGIIILNYLSLTETGPGRTQVAYYKWIHVENF